MDASLWTHPTHFYTSPKVALVTPNLQGILSTLDLLQWVEARYKLGYKHYSKRRRSVGASRTALFYRV